MYFWHISLCFYSNFDRESIITFFQVFLGFGVEGSVKSMLSGYSLETELNFSSNELSQSKLQSKYGEICKKYKQTKIVFFMIPIPKLILKKCLRPIRYFKFKSISLANTWWHGIWVKFPLMHINEGRTIYITTHPYLG